MAVFTIPTRIFPIMVVMLIEQKFDGSNWLPPLWMQAIAFCWSSALYG
jgi:hypothetical protein